MLHFIPCFHRGPHGWASVCRAALLWGGLCWWVAGVAHAQSVAFINPGKSDEQFWMGVSKVMHQAARSLGMQLEVLYAERDRLRPVALAQTLAQRPAASRPQYLIMTNESRVAPEMLRALQGADIQVFIAFNGIQQDQREQTGKPRERFAFWLGSLQPRAQDAGYLTAQALIAQARAHKHLYAPDGKLHLVAIAGDRSTPASVQRNEGMRRAVQEAKDVVFAQEVYSEWRKDKAQAQAKVLFQRYAQVRLVWAGNDQMAFGAMDAWRERGGVPGIDALFSGINTSQAALDARQTGALSVLAGGHFMAGAWALVMLHDHAKGIDFAAEGLELELPMFTLLDERNIPAFEARFFQLHSQADFKVFSKAHQPQLKKYDFNIERLLQ